MHHHPHSITGDMTGIFLIAGNWIPLMCGKSPAVNVGLLLLSRPAIIECLQIVGIVFGVLASIVAFVDYCMKIHWKVKQRKRNKGDESAIDSGGLKDYAAKKLFGGDDEA